MDVGDSGRSISIIDLWGLWSGGTGDKDHVQRYLLRLPGTNADGCGVAHSVRSAADPV